MDSKSRVACFVSGGGDSMALLELMLRYRTVCPIDLEALHFNFHLRGEESNRDEHFVREECGRKGIGLEVVDAPLTKGSGIQERAREIRRQVSAKLARKKKWTHLALGHQADDQADPVLHRLIRGAGLKGLRGMERESVLTGGVRLIRPLLSLPRDEIRQWAEQEGVRFISDSSNETDEYLRNRLRRHLLPKLKKEIPDFLEKISETCEALSEANRAIEAKVKAYLGASTGAYNTRDYLSQPQEIRFRVLRSVLEKGGYEKQFERKHFEELESILARNRGFFKEYGRAVFRHRKGVFSCQSREIPIA
ncbi:MAG: tRNA lysidine(34) synthetase TilS [Deltaproteobacteria bacterium]|nr:tRNA lysidine(34) synthetase TilS [Deltaproteobacteria bacterium]